MLIEETLFGQVDKVKIAINRLKLHEPDEGYYVAFSGGKDSCVVLDLCRRAGVRHDAHYAVTTVDPPELIYFIRENYPEAWEAREKPKDGMSMWKAIEKNMMPPTRLARYCCRIFKEGHGRGRDCIITGVRAKESARRARRQIIEPCRNHSRGTFLHIIFEWSEEDVWEYIHKYSVPYCSLYDEGYRRIGCIMCPFHSQSERQKDAERWSKYAENYKKAIGRACKIKAEKGLPVKPPDEVYEWWMSNKAMLEDNERKINLFGLLMDESDT